MRCRAAESGTCSGTHTNADQNGTGSSGVVSKMSKPLSRYVRYDHAKACQYQYSTSIRGPRTQDYPANTECERCLWLCGLSEIPDGKHATYYALLTAEWTVL